MILTPVEQARFDELTKLAVARTLNEEEKAELKTLTEKKEKV